MVVTSLAPGAAAGDEFRIGAVIGRTFSIFGRRFVPIMALAGIVSLPYLALFFAQQRYAPHQGLGASFAAVGRLYGTLAAPLVLGFVLKIAAQAIIIQGAFQDMQGRKVSIGDSLRHGLARFLPILGVLILEGVGLTLGFILLVIPGVILLTMWYIALPVCVVERLGPVASVNRSAALTRGHRWAVFGLILLVAVASFILGAVVGGVFALIGGKLALPFAQWAVQAITVALSSVLTVVLYHDLRVAKEGIDTETIAAIFD